MSSYPEHEKAFNFEEYSQVIQDFLDWLSEDQKIYLANYNRGITYFCLNCGELPIDLVDFRPASGDRWCKICLKREDYSYTVDFNSEGYYSARCSTKKLIADFFDIDLEKIANEKQQMSKLQKSENEIKSW